MPIPESIPAPVTSTCSKCRDRAATVGSRCVPCYVDRYARRIVINSSIGTTLHSRKWWKVHSPEFVAALSARLAAIGAGLEPGPKEDLIDLFWHGWTAQPYRRNRQPARAAITRIIDGADAVVKGEWSWRTRK